MSPMGIIDESCDWQKVSMVAVSFSGPASEAVVLVPRLLARPPRDYCSVTGGAVMEDNHVVVATVD